MPEDFIQYECVGGGPGAALSGPVTGLPGDSEEKAAMVLAKRLAAAMLIAVGAASAGPAAAQEPVRIGVIAEFSGPFADYGAQIVGGMKTYLKLNGEVFGGRKVELIIRDTTGPAPEIAKRHAQELLTRDNVDILAGFGLTPNALAVAPISAEAKKPMVIMNAATSVITTRSPYIVRVSHTLPQDTQPMAQWAARNGIKRVFTLVSDFGPGIDAETTFVKSFKAAGGEIVDSVRSPLANNDFAPFLQRIKDTRPEAVFVFLPPGSQTIGFIKGYEERGLKQAGIRIIATGDLTDDGVLQAMGDPTPRPHHQLSLLGGARFSREQGVHQGVRRDERHEASPQLHGVRRLRRNGGDRRGAQEDEWLHRSREVRRGDERHAPRQPARTDHDRSGNSRHRADRVHPPRRESRRTALQHRVRQVPRRQGSGKAALMASDGEDTLRERLAIREVVENWALWRDAGDWERFRTVWHSDARMMATWFQGSAERFIEASREGWSKGVSILHFLGGSTVEVEGARAVAQTKMTISQRAKRRRRALRCRVHRALLRFLRAPRRALGDRAATADL
jgi:ABC-type branched-subunit amino acid transport system substrate-binding protein